MHLIFQVAGGRLTKLGPMTHPQKAPSAVCPLISRQYVDRAPQMHHVCHMATMCAADLSWDYTYIFYAVIRPNLDCSAYCPTRAVGDTNTLNARR